MRTLWRLYYKITLGDALDYRLKDARLTFDHIEQATKGDLSAFYNVEGNQIRGWHEPITTPKHPLIKKYL